MKDGKTEKTVQALLAQTKAEQQLYDKRTEHFLRSSENCYKRQRNSKRNLATKPMIQQGQKVL